jgi:hypothetical protein
MGRKHLLYRDECCSTYHKWISEVIVWLTAIFSIPTGLQNLSSFLCLTLIRVILEKHLRKVYCSSIVSSLEAKVHSSGEDKAHMNLPQLAFSEVCNQLLLSE